MYDCEIKVGSVCFIRFLGMMEENHSILEKEFGKDYVYRSNSDSEPIVSVIFGEVPLPEGVSFVGRSHAYDLKGNCYVLEGKNILSLPLWVLGEVGKNAEIKCDKGFDVIRLIGNYVEPFMRIKALDKGHTFIHSSSVFINNRAILFPAWGNTGKTNLIIKLQEDNAVALSDDWSVWLKNGELAGYPRPINILNYNFKMFPKLKTKLSLHKKIFLKLDFIMFNLKNKKQFSKGILLRLSDVLERVLEILTNTHTPLPFEPSITDTSHNLSLVLSLEKVKNADSLDCGALDNVKFSRKHANCFIFENDKLIKNLLEFKFAFPNIDIIGESDIFRVYSNSLLDKIEIIGRDKINFLKISQRPNLSDLEKIKNLIFCKLK